MDRVLVTGGTGYIGSHLVRDLVAEGHRVRVLARGSARTGTPLPAVVELVAGDVTDAATVRQAVRDTDVVYHLAGPFREARVSDRRHREVHVTGTRLLLEAAHDEGVRRFVHCSTIGVHGHVEHPPADETYRFAPGDIYQHTKAETERLALDFRAERGLPITIVRPATTYGPGDLRLLKLFRMIAHGRFVFLGSGEVCLHTVHIEDLVRGFRLAADHPAADGEAFIIAGEEYRSLRDTATAIAETLGVPPPHLQLPAWPFFLAGTVAEKVCVPLGIEPPIYRRRVAFFTKNRAFSIEKARRVLGYRPLVALDRGLRETAEWYRAHGYLPGRAAPTHRAGPRVESLASVPAALLDRRTRRAADRQCD